MYSCSKPGIIKSSFKPISAELIVHPLAKLQFLITTLCNCHHMSRVKVVCFVVGEVFVPPET